MVCIVQHELLDTLDAKNMIHVSDFGTDALKAEKQKDIKDFSIAVSYQ